MPENPDAQIDHLENENSTEEKILGKANEELLSSLKNQEHGGIDSVKHTEMLHKNDGSKPAEILPGTLHAEDLRDKLIKFLTAHGFKPVDKNKHEKYRNDKNVTVGVPHQHRYFALFDKILKEAGYTKEDYIKRKNRGKKGNRRN